MTQERAFQIGLAMLRRYFAREGHARVPARHLERGFKLGQWVWLRRIDFRKRRLSPDRTMALEGIPGWSWEPRDRRFKETVALLRRYVRREGHARVPINHKEEGRRLGVWVGLVRRRYRLGKLPSDKIAKLVAIPGWCWEVQARDAFSTNLALLEAFVEREGHACVRAVHREAGIGLGAWVVSLRTLYRQGRLVADRVTKLERLPGWVWNRREQSFERGLQALLRYVEQHGHARVPAPHRGRVPDLAVWVSTQRKQYRRGMISPTRAKVLESFPGWTWDPRDDYFRVALGHLCDFARREGHSHVPYAHVEGGFPLGRWVNTKRRSYRKGSLEPRHVAELESVPGWVWRGRRGDRV